MAQPNIVVSSRARNELLKIETYIARRDGDARRTGLRVLWKYAIITIMSMKATDRPVQPFHYDPEDLEPRDAMLDDAAVDAYLERNKDALNVSIERAEAEYERGEYLTLDQVRAALDAQLEKIRGEQA